jgi:hypothetical protein
MKKSHSGFIGITVAGLLVAWLVLTASAFAQVSLSGTVKDNSANPISGAEVQVIDPATQQLVAAAMTDPTGQYSMLIAPGTYDVRVDPPVGSNFRAATAPGRVITGNTVLNFVLVPSDVAMLTGQVLDALGNGVPNVNVSLTPVGSGNPIQHATDQAGHYTFQVSPGDYNLSFNGYNWGYAIPNTPAIFGLSAQTPIALNESRILDVPLPLKRVSVHVQDLLGSAVQNVGLTTNSSYYPDQEIGGVIFGMSSYYPYSWPPAYTDVNGNVDLWLFPSNASWGNYVVTAAPPEGNPYAITSVHDVEVTTDRSLIIVLAEAVSFSGQVLDALGNGVPNVNVSLTPVGSGNPIQHATDQAGHYTFQVSPGDYNLSFNGYNWGYAIPNTPAIFGLSAQTPIALNESRILDVPLPLKRVSVHVQDLLGSAVQNVGLTTNSSYYPDQEIGGVIFGMSSYYPYSWPPAYTDVNGNVDLWLFPSNASWGNYVVTGTPPPDTPYAIFNVHDVTVAQDMSIVVVLELKGPSQNTCPLSHGFWKTHPKLWPLSKLWLGGQSYTQAELLSILGMPVKGDASVILAHQLIATKLNVANGSDPGPVITSVTSADNLLRTLAGRLPYGTKPSSAAGRAMTNLADSLDAYNNGLATPGCVQPTFTKTKTPTVVTAPSGPEVLQLETKVMELVSEGVLNKGQGQSLTVKLDAVMHHIEAGNNRVAGNLLWAFLHEVDALAAARILSPEARRDLADAALLILARLQT